MITTWLAVLFISCLLNSKNEMQNNSFCFFFVTTIIQLVFCKQKKRNKFTWQPTLFNQSEFNKSFNYYGEDKKWYCARSYLLVNQMDLKSLKHDEVDSVPDKWRRSSSIENWYSNAWFLTTVKSFIPVDWLYFLYP